jgi:hypothetical protein
LKKYESTYSVRTNENAQKLLEETYLKIFKERLNANLPMLTKGEAFALIVREAAAKRGVHV